MAEMDTLLLLLPMPWLALSTLVAGLSGRAAFRNADGSAFASQASQLRSFGSR